MTDPPTQALAFWTLAPGKGALRTEPLGEPGPDEVLVECHFTGVSRGTEALVFTGRVPESQVQAMRAPFQAGDFPGPVKYGYSAVGRVRRGPPALQDRLVFCLYPHQSAFVVPAEAVIALPAAVPPGRAVLAANMETAVNVLWDAGLRLGDRVTVVGGGAVGLMIGYLAARVPGGRTSLVDSDPGRAPVAEALGLAFALPDQAAGDQDVVIHASASEAGLDLALRLAGTDTTVIEASWFGDRPVRLALGEDFHSRRLHLRASQVGEVAAARRHRRSRTERLALAIDLLADPCLDRLITGESALEDLPRTMARLAAEPAGTLCHRVRHPAAPPSADGA